MPTYNMTALRSIAEKHALAIYPSPHFAGGCGCYGNPSLVCEDCQDFIAQLAGEPDDTDGLAVLVQRVEKDWDGAWIELQAYKGEDTVMLHEDRVRVDDLDAVESFFKLSIALLGEES